MRPRTARLVAAVSLAALVGSADADAQLNLTFLSSFVDTQAGGNGNIGVTQDEIVGDFHVIDFSNALTVHQYDANAQFKSQFGTTSCSPSAASPNDIVWDSHTDTLWLVDNTGDIVLNVDRAGTCLGGFALGSAISNPTGIGYDRQSQTLARRHTQREA